MIGRDAPRVAPRAARFYNGRTGVPAGRWARSAADLRLALALGAGAAGRLVAGLAGLAGDLLAGRGRDGLADCAFNADARTCRAH